MTDLSNNVIPREYGKVGQGAIWTTAGGFFSHADYLAYKRKKLIK
jgi:hypothetical protein